MTKHHWRESVKSLFGSHIDPARDEQLKETKIEIEDRVQKILKYIKNENLDETDNMSAEYSKKEPVIEVIEDFLEQYQRLYAQYDHLTGEIRDKVHGKQENETFSSSSDSDSDNSLKDKGSKNGKLKSESKKMMDGTKQELETASLEIADMKRKLTATIEEKEALNLEYLTASSNIRESEKIITDLNQKLDAAGKMEAELNQRLENMISEKDSLIMEKETATRRIEEGEKITDDLKTMNDQLKDENANLRLELEASKGELSKSKQLLEQAEQQVTELSNTLKATDDEKKSLTLKISEISNEIEQAQNVIQELTTESSQLKERSGEKVRELSDLTEMHHAHKNESSAEIKGLQEQVMDLELELQSLRTQKREMEMQIGSRTTEANQVGEENVGLQARVLELELISKGRGDELSALTKKLEDSENESTNRVADLKAQVNSLLQDMDSLRTQKGELEELIGHNSNEASTQVKGLSEQVSALQQELESLNSQKSEMELQFGREKQELSESLNQMGNQNTELTSQIADLQRLLKEHEDAYNKLSEENKRVEGRLQECMINLKFAEKKMEEMEGEFDKNIGFKDQIVADLEETVEDLKRDLEVKSDELSSLTDNVRNIEVKLRLSNQKLRVTDQLLTEKEEIIRNMEAKFQQEKRLLEGRIATLSKVISAHRKMITDISDNTFTTLNGLETVIQKFEEDYGNYETRILEVSDEIRIAKHWITEANNEKQLLKEKVSNLVEQLEAMKMQELTLNEKVKTLEGKASREELEKDNLSKTLKQLEKKVEVLERTSQEQDEGLLGLGEEKREAIRQLCVCIDYHRDRYDDLKEILSRNMPLRSQRAN